jgi:hypothetical protein
MERLQKSLVENKQSDIFTIAQYIDNHITENWETLLLKHHDKLLRAFDKAGDMAYGAYLNFLFLPIHQQLKQIGLHPQPRFPGDFSISREWGNQAETEQQRWMWSAINSTAEKSIGTIVTITFHDHTQFRIPKKPQIIALAETTQEDVVKVLSQRSADFYNALEFKIEYAEYLRNLEQA